jgi:hypothetical protein
MFGFAAILGFAIWMLSGMLFRHDSQAGGSHPA